MKAIFLSEGLRMFLRRFRVLFKGFHTFEGDAEAILKQVVDSCWNGRYFQTSSGHFSGFYIRDFSWCIEALLTLGYDEKVKKTLEYALGQFKKHGHVTVAINPSSKCFDFPMYGEDSVPCLLKCLDVLGDKKLIEEHRVFLQHEILYYFSQVFDVGGEYRRDRSFSSIRDHAERMASCYGFAHAGMLIRIALKHGFNVGAFEKIDFEQRLVYDYWNGAYFFEDTRKQNIVVADAQLFPFWCGIVRDNKIMKKAFDALSQEGLDKPFPLRYTCKKQKLSLWNVFAEGYEQKTVWMHLGMIYMQLCRNVFKDQYARMIKQYLSLVAKHQTFLEVYDSQGHVFSRLLYISDEGMLWASILLGEVYGTKKNN